MKQRTRWWLLALIALALITTPACNTEDGDSDPPNGDDNGGDDNGGDDNGGDDEKERPKGSAKLGDLCDQDDECASGFCVAIGSGKDEGLCSKRCEVTNDCDTDGWICRNISGGSGDDIRGCAPKTLCIDNDGDGYGVGPECNGTDCDDEDPTVYEGAPEVCDGKDNSCDGRTDVNPIDVGRSCNTGLLGVCADGMSECNDGTLDCVQLIAAGQEICDGLDNDCDGLVDEDVTADENDNFIRDVGRACAPDGSECQNGVYVCDPVGEGGLYCDGLGDDAVEICDGIDNNCNGQIDEGIDGLGEVCIVGEGRCVNASAKICDPDDPNAPPICAVEPDWDKQQDEVCNFEDSDCNGTVDDPFVNDDDLYFTTEHCGGCDNDCATQWGSDVNPAAVQANPICDVTGGNAECGFECTSDYIDMDGVVDNGCELLPDEDGIYVATPAKGGSDSNTCGSYDAPCATITKGIERAESAGRSNVRVSDGIFREGVVLKNGISVLGGHSSVNWLRDTAVNTTTIYGAASTFPNDAVAVVAQNITSTTEFSGFNVSAPDADVGGNSIALFIEGSSNKLSVKDNTLQAGFGGQGAVGSAGGDGQQGEDGSDGKQGTAHSSCSSSNHLATPSGGSTTCGGTSTAGGRGGGSSCPEAGAENAANTLPQAGQNNSGDFGDAGFSAWGRHGTGNKNCLPDKDHIFESFARDGAPGRTGSDGSSGSGGAASNDALANKMWRAATGGSGSTGTSGGGGGGGGAAHGVERTDGSVGLKYQLGATGGGGGAGGCAGSGAEGGSGGGGSFALYLIADGSSTPTITENTLARGVGGVGGSGGLGGAGAFGGAGGQGGPDGYSGSSGWDYCSQIGRTGGDGGRGGHGGGGGGGAGGNAFDIASKGASNSDLNAIVAANTFLVDENEDTAGNGGNGGPSMGTSGENGDSGQSGRRLTLP